MLHRHERTCEAKVYFKFPGGAYNSPPTIFQLLEGEGFTIPQQLRYFPYRATFDFECMFNRNPGWKNTKKLSWHAKHVPLSVSVCSNVPNFTEPKCLVSEGDSTQLVRDMVNYLVEISKESCGLMKQEFASLFRAIDDRLEKREKESRVDEEDSDDEGEDIVDTDGEEELIESENEEDRAFLNDEVEDEQGPSFYRALDQKHRRMTDEDCKEEDSTNKTKTEFEKKRQNPLQKLRDRFEDYLKKIPVVGFNSGRYDLNAVKKFLFPVLVKDEEVQSTIKRNHNFMCLLTEHLRFLDVTNFLAPGFTYDKFLKAYECPQTKGFFRTNG